MFCSSRYSVFFSFSVHGFWLGCAQEIGRCYCCCGCCGWSLLWLVVVVVIVVVFVEPHLSLRTLAILDGARPARLPQEELHGWPEAPQKAPPADGREPNEHAFCLLCFCQRVNHAFRFRSKLGKTLRVFKQHNGTTVQNTPQKTQLNTHVWCQVVGLSAALEVPMSLRLRTTRMA